MTTEAERQKANIIPPFASAVPGLGVTALNATTTAAAIDLNLVPSVNASLTNRYIDLQADGGAVYVSFSSDGVPVIDETAGGTTLAAGTLATVPWLIPAGATLSVRCERLTHRFVHFKTASGTAKLRIRPSSQIRSSDK